MKLSKARSKDELLRDGQVTAFGYDVFLGKGVGDVKMIFKFGIIVRTSPLIQFKDIQNYIHL